MPKGQYQRTSRGPYKKENGTMVKKTIYLTREQYEKLKQAANEEGISYAELIRKLIDNYFQIDLIDNVN